MKGKNDQESLKNAGIPTGIFEGLLKTSSFLTAPLPLLSAGRRRSISAGLLSQGL